MQSHAGEGFMPTGKCNYKVKKTVFGSAASIKICSIRNNDFNKEEEPFVKKRRRKKKKMKR